MSLDTDETTEFFDRFSVFILGGKLLNAFIQPFKLIAKGRIGQQIFVEDLSASGFNDLSHLMCAAVQ